MLSTPTRRQHKLRQQRTQEAFLVFLGMQAYSDEVSALSNRQNTMTTSQPTERPNSPPRRRSTKAPKPAASVPSSAASKVQINVLVSPEHRDRLRAAAIELSSHASMGDIVAALIDDALDRVVDQLADTTPRLRAGRKVATTQPA